MKINMCSDNSESEKNTKIVMDTLENLIGTYKVSTRAEHKLRTYFLSKPAGQQMFVDFFNKTHNVKAKWYKLTIENQHSYSETVSEGLDIEEDENLIAMLLKG